MIRLVELKDVPALCRIYNYYVESTTATFEEVPVSQEEFAHRLSLVTKKFPWLVLESSSEGLDREVVGFAYANHWKARIAYCHTVETTIYMSPHHAGKGYGESLYSSLLDKLSLQDDIHKLLACISLPNDASVSLHEKLGFRKIGHFAEVGKKFGQWIDVGYWEFRGSLT